MPAVVTSRPFRRLRGDGKSSRIAARCPMRQREQGGQPERRNGGSLKSRLLGRHRLPCFRPIQNETAEAERGRIPVSREVAAGDMMELPILPTRGSTVPTTKPRRTLDELSRLGGEIFDRQVQPMLRPEDDGKFVAIDVETGDYQMDEDDNAGIARLRSRNPLAEIWLMRAGYPAAYRIEVRIHARIS